MGARTANQAAESLLPATLLAEEARATLLDSPVASLLLKPGSGKVLWASHAAARLLGFADGKALMLAGLPASAAGTLRLAQILADGPGPRRLERLRFTIAFRSTIVIAICAFVPLASGGHALSVGFPEASTAEVEPMPELLPAAALPAEPADIAASATIAQGNAPVATGRPGWTDMAAEQRAVVRFVFGLDRDGLVERVSPPLAQTVGTEHADMVGQSLAGFVQRFDATAAEAIRSAILTGETWPAIRTLWPVAGAALQVPVVLNALPISTTDDGLTGFSGFGRCDLRQAVAAAVTDEPKLPMAEPVVPAMDHPAPASGDADPVASDEAGDDNADAGIPEPHGDEAVAVADHQPASQLSSQADADAEDAQDQPEAAQADAPDPAEVAAAVTEDTPLMPLVEAETSDEPVAGAEAGADDESSAEDRETADLIAALEAFGATDTPADPPPTAEQPTPQAGIDPRSLAAQIDNVIALRQGPVAVPPGSKPGLSMAERNAFREIAKALGAKLDTDFDPPGEPAAEPAKAGTAAEGPATPASEAAVPSVAGSFALMDRLPVGILVSRGDELLFVNRTLLDLTAYPDLETFAAEGGAQAIFRKSTMPRDRETAFDTVILTARNGEMMPVDAHLQTMDWQGQPASLLTLRRAVELEQGKALRSVALDLKRVRTEANELRAVLDTATDGVITLDDRGLILSINGAAEALFGLSQNEVAGESFTVLLHNESHADALDYFEGLRSNSVRSVLNDGRDVQGREKKGGRIPLFMTLGRISDEEPRRFCAVLRDLTAWKRAEAELTEARRAAELASAKKSDFLTKISHEIRTPMNAIIGFAEVMLEERLGQIGNPKYKEYLGDIRTSGQHVVSLVNDLLDLAKIEAGRMEMRFAATDLNSIVGSCVGIIQPQANAHRVLVRTQLANRLPPVVADERSIRQIILNMLSNATRFTESGGQVIVATALLDTGEAVIRIRDTGIGMTATEIEHALEPFRQVGTRRDHGGTGLGLPLTKALVEANRANFAIRSTPGEGTMVEITFPSTRVLAE